MYFYVVILSCILASRHDYILICSEFTSKVYIIADLKCVLAGAVYIQGLMSDAIKYHILWTVHRDILAY